METFKKYLPLIVLAVVGYLLIRKVSQSSSGNITTNLTTVTPDTAAARQPLTDPLLPYRAAAFDKLSDVAIAQTAADTQAKTLASQERIATAQVNLQQQSLANQLQQYLAGVQGQLTGQLAGYKSAENIAGIQGATQQALANAGASTQAANQAFLQNSYLKQLELYYQQRDADRQAQQAAINRAQSNQQTASILGSINTALGRIFGGAQSGNVYGTPPTFPSSGGFNLPSIFGGGSSSGGGYSNYPVLVPIGNDTIPDYSGPSASDQNNPYLSGGYGGSGVPDYGMFNNGFSAFFQPNDPTSFFV